MKPEDLPPEHKLFTIELSNGRTFTVNEEDKKKIVSATQNFITLKTGEILNKAFIVSIYFDREITKEHFQSLPEPEQEELVQKYGRNRLMKSN